MDDIESGDYFLLPQGQPGLGLDDIDETAHAKVLFEFLAFAGTNCPPIVAISQVGHAGLSVFRELPPQH